MTIFPAQLQEKCSVVSPAGKSAQRIVRVYADKDGTIWVMTPEDKYQIVSCDTVITDNGAMLFSFNLSPLAVMK